MILILLYYDVFRLNLNAAEREWFKISHQNIFRNNRF